MLCILEIFCQVFDGCMYIFYFIIPGDFKPCRIDSPAKSLPTTDTSLTLFAPVLRAASDTLLLLLSFV